MLQSSVNIYNALGIPGDLAYSGPNVPLRAQPYNLVSTPYANRIGYAFTETSAANPDPFPGSPIAGTARVGGTGKFAGILVNPKEQALYGTSLSPLSPSLDLPDNAIGSLLDMGFIFVSLPGPAAPGDLVTYDTVTGALNSIPAETVFTGSIATTTLTVSAITSGEIRVGQRITGVNVAPDTYITALGTGLGGTGTYTVGVSQTAASAEIRAASLPAASFSVTGSIAPGASPTVDPSVLTVTAVGSGALSVGDQLFGTGIPENTVIVSLGTGVGGTGTYNVNQVNVTAASTTITGPTNAIVPNASVYRFQANTTGGVAVIKLTN